MSIDAKVQSLLGAPVVESEDEAAANLPKKPKGREGLKKSKRLSAFYKAHSDYHKSQMDKYAHDPSSKEYRRHKDLHLHHKREQSFHDYNVDALRKMSDEEYEKRYGHKK